MGWRNRILSALADARSELDRAYQAATKPERKEGEADADEIVLRALVAQRCLTELLLEMAESCSLPRPKGTGAVRTKAEKDAAYATAKWIDRYIDNNFQEPLEVDEAAELLAFQQLASELRARCQDS